MLVDLMSSYLNDLHNNICFVKFTKKDGSIREMRCTLLPNLLPAKTDLEEHTQRKQPTESIAVWDLDKNDWRSFRVDSILGFTILPSS
jgi:WYL_2, Sm-like SH3 beta-barrel fold